MDVVVGLTIQQVKLKCYEKTITKASDESRDEGFQY